MKATKQQQAELIKIKKRADFLKIQGKGRKWVSHGLVIQTMPNDEDIKRIGFTVSKRTDKSSVKRNRIKRRLNAAAADILPLYAREGHDYILVGRPQTLTRPYETLKKDILWCLGKLELLEES